VSQSVCVSWMQEKWSGRERQSSGERGYGAEESGRALGREGMERERAVELWRERVRREKGEGEGGARTYALAPQPLFDKYYRRGERISGSTLKKAAVECLVLPPLPDDPPPPRCMAPKSRSESRESTHPPRFLALALPQPTRS